MEIGYIKLYRKITNSFVWTNPNMLKLWLLCLMKASHKESRFLFNGQEVVVNSGEFVTGRVVITKEMNEGVPPEQQVNSGSVWRWLKKFESEQMLDIKSTNKYSVISIKNWHEYQVSEQQVNSNRTSSEHPAHTYKNDKNDKNDKNLKDIPPKSKKRIYETDSIHYQLAQKLYERIKENYSELKEPNLQVWSDDIRKMIELDRRTEKQASNMIDWCQDNDFWRDKILSAKKLREKYDTMKAQALNQPKRSYSKHVPKVETLPDWAKEGYEPPKEEMMSEEMQQKFDERLKKIRERAKGSDRIGN